MKRTIILAWCALLSGCMPGQSFRGTLPPLDREQAETAERLKRDVSVLADEIGERHVLNVDAYHRAADFITESLGAPPIAVTRQSFTVPAASRGEDREIVCFNIIGELPGTAQPGQIVVVGAHYDSVVGTVGANDNASGVAALMELARRLASNPPPRTVRFVAFANEEPPFFKSPLMGSWQYAAACREAGDPIVDMMSIDGVGYYSDQPGGQTYPAVGGWFFPSRPNYIAFVGDMSFGSPLRRAVGTFRRTTRFPSQAFVFPRWVQGVDWSDHWSFWQHGYPAFMVTDTLPYRYEHYHRETDTPDRLDYARLARVVDGLEAVVRNLAGEAARN